MPSKERVPSWQNGHILNKLLRPYYRSDLPFHNFAHVQRATRLALRFASVATRHGVEIEDDLLPLVGRGHDAGTWLTPKTDHPFALPEGYSADIVKRVGRSLGMPEQKVKRAGQIALSTAVDIPCKTNTARCMRRGDLAAGGLLDSPVAFVNGTYRLYKEDKLIKKETLIPPITKPAAFLQDFLNFGKICQENLNAYLAEDISLGHFDRDGEGHSLFAVRAARNVDLLIPAKMTEFLSAHLGEVVNYSSASVPTV